MPKHSWYLPIWAASVVLVGFGCGGKDQPVKVHGIVTLDGEPVHGAIVSFLPDEKGGRFAVGTTAKDGSFRLKTYKDDDGALPGDYRVTVTLIPLDDEEEVEGKEEVPAKEKVQDAKAFMAAMAKMAAAAQKALEKSPIPAIYRDGGQTPLRQIVPTNGKVILALKREQPQAKNTESEKSAEQTPFPPKGPGRP
jgi:hypothetical protein